MNISTLTCICIVNNVVFIMRKKKMKKIISGLILLCVSVNMLIAMENNKINLRLVDDCNKTYSIDRWKVVQDSSQIDTLNIPGLTKQQISFFEKELDEFDLNRIQGNNLTQDIKEKIMLHELIKKNYLPAYKTAFDYLLVSMIADNIRNNRVKTEEAYVFESKSVQEFLMGHLHMPSVDKLEKNSFVGKLSLCGEDFPDNVMIVMPLSTMAYTSFNAKNDSCVNIFNKAKNDLVGEYIGTVRYNQKNINGLGFTNDLRYLVATFDGKLVSKAELYSDDDYTAYKDITNNIKLVDIYLLYHLYQVKKEGRYEEFQSNECSYLHDHVAKSERGKELIKKHFL
jgi:hypothetical protein